MKLHVTYDTRSGQIVSVQHGSADANFARQQAHRRTKIAHEHLGSFEVSPDAVRPGKFYKVDAQRKALVEAAEGEKGISFSGGTGRK